MAERRRQDREVHRRHGRHAQDQLRVADPAEARGPFRGHGNGPQAEAPSLGHADADAAFIPAKENALATGERFDQGAFRGSGDGHGRPASIGTKGFRSVGIPVLQLPEPRFQLLHQKKAI